MSQQEPTTPSSSSSSSQSSYTLAHIRGWADELQQYGLIDAGPHQSLLAVVSEAEQGGLGQAQQPLLTVLLFGPSGVGKSQLLNALAGDVIARSHYERPTTRVPTVYAHADVDIERLFEYGTELGEMAQQPTNIIRHMREPLRNIVIVDAPDIDSYQREHRERVLRLLPMMDIVLYVVTAQTYLNDLGWQTVLKERGRRAFAFIINKWDHEGKRSLDSGSEIDIDTHFRQLLRERAGYEDALIFRTSAEYWLHQRQNLTAQDESPPAGDQFPELEAWLSGALTTSHVAEIQRRRRRAMWGSVAEGVSQAVPVHLDDDTWREQTLAQLDGLRAAGWQQIQPAVRMSAAELAHLSPVGRWPSSPGPFGLVLRVGEAVRSGLVGLMRRGVPVQIGPMRSTIALAPDLDPSSHNNLALTTTDTTGLVTIADGTVADVSLALRAGHVPSLWLTERLRASVATLGPRLGNAMRVALAEAIEKPYSRARYIAGSAVLVLTELALVAVLGVAAWRLIEGYILRAYVDSAFATNLFLLLGLIVLLGLLGLSASFPRPETIVAKHLDKRLQQVWNAFVDELRASTNEFAQITKQLNDDGTSIKESINAELRAVAPRVGDDEGDAQSGVGQLFAE